MMPVKGGGCAVFWAIKKTADRSAVYRSREARIILRPLLPYFNTWSEMTDIR